MDAINTPVRGRRKEVHTDDFEIGQRAPVDLSLDKELERGEIVDAIDGHINKAYLDELEFMEDPVTIMLQASAEKFAPKYVQCFVNGRGAEILTKDGKWISVGWIPVSQPVTTRRKYVEVLARSKHDSIQTVHGSAEDETIQNGFQVFTSAKHPLSVLEDKNPKGFDWLAKIYAER